MEELEHKTKELEERHVLDQQILTENKNEINRYTCQPSLYL